MWMLLPAHRCVCVCVCGGWVRSANLISSWPLHCSRGERVCAGGANAHSDHHAVPIGIPTDGRRGVPTPPSITHGYYPWCPRWHSWRENSSPRCSLDKRCHMIIFSLICIPFFKPPFPIPSHHSPPLNACLHAWLPANPWLDNCFEYTIMQECSWPCFLFFGLCQIRSFFCIPHCLLQSSVFFFLKGCHFFSLCGFHYPWTECH